MPGAYLLTGPEFAGRVPGEMTEIRMRIKIGSSTSGSPCPGRRTCRMPSRNNAVSASCRCTTSLCTACRTTPSTTGPSGFPELTAPDDLALFDRIGAAMCYMLPLHADVNDTCVQALATIGLSVADGFSWRGLDESVVAGLRRAAPVVDQIIDERWQSMSDTVNGWRGSLASGRCSYDWPLNAANTKNQVGTELADQVVYLNCRVDGDGHPFDGASRYVLHFEPGQTPAVWAMWNLSMYDDDMLFIRNEIDRFSIGNTTAGAPSLRLRHGGA